MTDTTYSNVTDMVRDLTNDSEIVDAVQDALERQTIIRQLMAMRASAGLSQKDVSDIIGCSQSRISKIENSADDDLRYGELGQYADAVGGNLVSGVRPKNMTPADEVKCLAFAVNNRLSRMSELAKVDEDVAEGVAKFFCEAFINFSMIVGKAAAALPQNPDGTPRFRLNLEIGRSEEGNESLDSDTTPNQISPDNSLVAS